MKALGIILAGGNSQKMRELSENAHRLQLPEH